MWKQPVFKHTGGLDDAMLSNFLRIKDLQKVSTYPLECLGFSQTLLHQDLGTFLRKKSLNLVEIEKVEMAQNSDKHKNLQLGVDKNLIEMFLKMTSEERVRSNDNTIRALVELRNGFKKQKTSSFRSKQSA
jgi:hypothetical protein